MNRYEEVEVRKKLEEMERQEEKKRREQITEKDGGRSSPKVSSVSKKDSKKVVMVSAFSNKLTHTLPEFTVF